MPSMTDAELRARIEDLEAEIFQIDRELNTRYLARYDADKAERKEAGDRLESGG